MNPCRITVHYASTGHDVEGRMGGRDVFEMTGFEMHAEALVLTRGDNELFVLIPWQYIMRVEVHPAKG